MKRREEILTSIDKTGDFYSLYYMPGTLDFEVMKDPAIMPFNAKNFYITGYSSLEKTDLAKEYKDNYTVFNNPTGYSYAVIAGILDGFIDTNKKYPTTKVNLLLPLLYNKPLLYPGGELYILPNHFITLSLKICTIYNTNAAFVETFTIPYDLDFEVSGYYGTIATTTCNFKTNPIAGISDINPLPIGFILDMSTYKNKFIRFYIDKMIAEAVYIIFIIIIGNCNWKKNHSINFRCK